jgi:DNA-binding PadR family transcriptional regulator
MNSRTRSPLGLILLLNLLQGPSHAYRLHKLLQQTGKDRIVNVKSRASVYQTIEQLQRDRLIDLSSTSSTPGYPDRIVYAITDHGREVALEWLRELLASTGPDTAGFIVALSAMFVLSPSRARSQLETRRAKLIAELEESQQAIDGPDVPRDLPRLFLLDEHYRRAMLTADLAFTEGLISDLAEGSLSWNQQWLKAIATRFTQPE